MSFFSEGVCNQPMGVKSRGYLSAFFGELTKISNADNKTMIPLKKKKRKAGNEFGVHLFKENMM